MDNPLSVSATFIQLPIYLKNALHLLTEVHFLFLNNSINFY